MRDKLMTMEELHDFLGFDDHRAVQKWCNKNCIPLIKMGAKYYAHKWVIENVLLRLNKNFFTSNGKNGDAIVSAILDDD